MPSSRGNPTGETARQGTGTGVGNAGAAPDEAVGLVVEELNDDYHGLHPGSTAHAYGGRLCVAVDTIPVMQSGRLRGDNLILAISRRSAALSTLRSSMTIWGDRQAEGSHVPMEGRPKTTFHPSTAAQFRVEINSSVIVAALLSLFAGPEISNEYPKVLVKPRIHDVSADWRFATYLQAPVVKSK